MFLHSLIIFLFFQNFFVTLSLIILTFILYFIYDKIFKTKLINSGKNLNDSSDAMYKFISQTLDGFKEIRILGKENFFFNQIKENTRIWTDAFKKYS